MPLRTVLIDQHILFTEILGEKLESLPDFDIEVVGSFSNGLRFLDAIEDIHFDFVFMELNIPSIDGLQLIPRIKKFKPKSLICVLSGYSNRKFVQDVFKKGADGYFLKKHSVEDLIYGINEVLKGHRHIAKALQITPSLKENEPEKDTLNPIFQDGFNLKNKLTPREREILKLIVQAKNNKEIGKELFISDQTVGVHRKNIMRKLGVRNSISLIRFAMDNKLV